MNDRLPLRPGEIQLDGAWIETTGVVSADDVERRIIWLAETQLERLADSADAWSTLLRDPLDHRLWELTFPQSGIQGGGPKRLAVITLDAARARYRVTLTDIS